MTEYGGKTKEVTGKIIDVTEKNNHDYEVIAEYYPQAYYLETKLYTQKFIVSTRNSGGDSENSAGGGNAPITILSPPERPTIKKFWQNT